MSPSISSAAQVFALGVNDLLHRGFLEREGRLDGREVSLIADTAVALPALLERCRELTDPRPRLPAREPRAAAASGAPGPIDTDRLVRSTFEAVRDGPWRLAHGLARGSVRRHWDLEQFGCHLGGSGGAGLGYGVGATVGAAIAAEGSDTLTVSLQPEGDLLYTPAGLWTAARESLSMLTVVVNNGTYGQDRMHQGVMSRTRGRPIEHASVGIDLDQPRIDLARLAEAQGVEAFGPVRDGSDLEETLRRAAAIVRTERRPVLVDVEVTP